MKLISLLIFSFGFKKNGTQIYADGTNYYRIFECIYFYIFASDKRGELKIVLDFNEKNVYFNRSNYMQLKPKYEAYRLWFSEIGHQNSTSKK